MPLERRTLLKVLSAGSLPLGPLHGAISGCAAGVGSSFDNYRFVFFTPGEQALVHKLMELILPADDHSPGAGEARVPAFADRMLSAGSDRAREQWRAGLAAFGAASASEDLATILDRAAQEEAAPKSLLGRFFISLKRMTVDGYYTSRTGIELEMRYEGNAHLTQAPSCSHPEHKAR